MQGLRAMLTLLAPALAWCAPFGPPANAKPAVRQDRAAGIAAFTHHPGDDIVLAWAKRWADDNLDDPAEHFAMLSYAVSAAEARQVSIAHEDNKDYAFDQLFGEMHIGVFTEFTHLRHVTFLAELRTATASAGSTNDEPEWSARHLCNGSLITPHWILTTLACVSQPAASKGIEARLGLRDLSQAGGISRRVIRIARNPGAGLALLELDAAARTEDAVTIAPPAALTSSDYGNLGLGFGRTALPGWPRVLYRHFSLDGLNTLCPGDDGSPIYAYDLQQGPLLAGLVIVPGSADRGCPESGSPQAQTVSIDRWSSWIGQVTGVRPIVTKPRRVPTFVPQAH